MRNAAKRKVDGEMLDEYDFSKGVRGKYATRYAEGSNIIVLAPDLAKIFPESSGKRFSGPRSWFSAPLCLWRG